MYHVAFQLRISCQNKSNEYYNILKYKQRSEKQANIGSKWKEEGLLQQIHVTTTFKKQKENTTRQLKALWVMW